MAKAFDPIKAAGQKGDSSKAKDAYKKVKTCSLMDVFIRCVNITYYPILLLNKASATVEAYLEAVELPAMSDATYD